MYNFGFIPQVTGYSTGDSLFLPLWNIEAETDFEKSTNWNQNYLPGKTPLKESGKISYFIIWLNLFTHTKPLRLLLQSELSSPDPEADLCFMSSYCGCSTSVLENSEHEWWMLWNGFLSHKCTDLIWFFSRLRLWTEAHVINSEFQDNFLSHWEMLCEMRSELKVYTHTLTQTHSLSHTYRYGWTLTSTQTHLLYRLITCTTWPRWYR